jgi:hypothetical protein
LGAHVLGCAPRLHQVESTLSALHPREAPQMLFMIAVPFHSYVLARRLERKLRKVVAR